ncbi:MAG: phage tail sheath family protein [Nitrospirota bacterium]|nr:MAG: phage tail sheath family protein [Nitrospirota bacterium]
MNTRRGAINRRVMLLVRCDLFMGAKLSVSGESGRKQTPCGDELTSVARPIHFRVTRKIAKRKRRINYPCQRAQHEEEAGCREMKSRQSVVNQSKGTLVWGARTLAGNHHQHRYVSARRFLIFVEESIKRGIKALAFEPNDANTWGTTSAMIENFLMTQWRDGAVQGTKSEEAFFVKVGLNQTMSAQDVREGRMIVELGLAVVRPAEFVILRFTQSMQ